MSEVPVSALYYPHTSIRSPGLIKTALLLWDHVECIVPDTYERSTHMPRDLAEATEIIVRPHKPSESAKMRVHERLTALMKNGVPPWVRANAGPDGLHDHYLMYADKLLHETWTFLAHHDLLAPSPDARDYAVPPALGLLMLAMLADECAGTTRTKVTDREQAYNWLFGAMTSELGGEYLATVDASHLADTYDRLVTATVRILNVESIPMNRLLSVRKKNDAALRPLRKRYLERLGQHVSAMLAPKVSLSDRDELARSFEADMAGDFAALRQDLGYAAKEALFSKEIGVCALAVAGVAFAPATLPVAAKTLATVGVGALLSTHTKYRKARAKALADHPTSWLYSVSRSGLPAI